MNTPKSMALGWAGLVAAAGIGYYYARKDINERRRIQAIQGSRPTEKLGWQDKVERSMSYNETPVKSNDGVPPASPTPTSVPLPPDKEIWSQILRHSHRTRDGLNCSVAL